MKISLEWLLDFVPLPVDGLDVAALAHELTLRTVEVESLVRPGDQLADAVVGRVVARTGTAGVTVALDEDGTTLVAESPAASPAVGTLVVVDRARRRLCRPQDLGVELLCQPTEHGLIDPSALGVLPGDAFAAVVGWDNDVVFEIDQKSLTNRPDLWGHRGVARELAAIYGVPLHPVPRRPPAPHLPTAGLIGTVDPAICRAFSLTLVDRTGDAPPTPLWMRSRLARVGQRCLGLYADLTNYVMFAIGQPSHAYDSASLRLPLDVRFARDAEATMQFLNDQTIELDASMPVIADADGPVAIAGIVGGVGSHARPSTSSHAIEVGNFDQRAVRTAVLRKGCRTEAASRFEKGLDTQSLELGRDYLLHLLAEIDPGAEVTGFAVRLNAPTKAVTVDVRLRFLEDRLGAELPAGDVASLLEPLGFTVTSELDDLRIGVPTWRSTGDVSIPHDILEEVARRIGYDNLPASTPLIALRSGTGGDVRAGLERRVREHLALRGGMQEVLTYPWTTHGLLEATRSTDDVIEFDGAPSPDRRFLRRSLLPNLFEAAQQNLAHFAAFDLFEVGSVYYSATRSSLTTSYERLPSQPRHVAGIFAGAHEEAVFRRASGMVTGLARAAWMRDVSLERDASSSAPGPRLVILASGRTVGAVSVADATLVRTSRRNVALAWFELDLERVEVLSARSNEYEPVRQHPDTRLDLSVTVADDVTWADISAVARNADPRLRRVEFVEEFRGRGLPDGTRSVTMRLTLAADDGTLDAVEAIAVRDRLLDQLAGPLGAALRT